MRFIDPPQTRRLWAQRLAPLVERPGEWALVLETKTPARAHGHAGNLKRGRYVLPDGAWEFTSRTLDSGKGGVFARYLGAFQEAA